MKKLISLKQNKDFRRVYHRGKSVVTPWFVIYYTKSRGKCCKLGITAGKKIGNAVQRNRVKRVVRAAYSAVIDYVDVSRCCYDFVIVARKRCVTAKSDFVAKKLYAALQNAGLIDGAKLN